MKDWFNDRKGKNPYGMVEAVARGGAVKDAGHNLVSPEEYKKTAPEAAAKYEAWKAGKISKKELDAHLDW